MDREPLGVWCSYYDDLSAVVPHACELDALRAAVDRGRAQGDQAILIRWGETVRDAENRKYNPGTKKPAKRSEGDA